MARDIPMFYRHNNIILELTGSKGTLFIDDKLIFKGFGYQAIKMYIHATGDDPEASKPFKKIQHQKIINSNFTKSKTHKITSVDSSKYVYI